MAYQAAAKIGLLGVPAPLIAEHTAVSAPVAEAMAKGIRERLDVDLAIRRIDRQRGADRRPGCATRCTWDWRLATASWSARRPFNWFGTRTEIQSRVAKMALNRLRLHLQRTPQAQG